jgi:hypothetical protein
METSTDASQRLLFGSYRVGVFDPHGAFECLEEGLIVADDLQEYDSAGWAVLEAYARDRAPATTNPRRPALALHSRRAFVEKRLWKAIEAGALIVGYNLAFDLTRLAVHCGDARKPMFAGGFSLALWEWQDDGVWKEKQHRPRLQVKALDSKRTLMGLSRRNGAPPAERRQPLEALGRLLDLKHLTFALTDRHLSLAGAAMAFGLSASKLEVGEHGVITADYIDYNRRDVEVTAKLLEAVRAEWDRHPLALSPDKVMSPAGLGKGYLRALGVTPPARQFADVGPDVLGACMTAYFGGRTEVRIRRAVVPVVYVDFLSMYPTVNALMGIWQMLTADHLKLQDATAAVRARLSSLTPEECFSPAFWPELRFFAKIRPQGDILPVRAAYGPLEDNTTIGVNPLSSEVPIWVAGPDLVASIVLTGRVPEILEAIRLVPVGRQEGLTPVALRGQVTIDPAQEDFFARLIEERQYAQRRPDLSEEERRRLSQFLKVMANSASYGIYAELNPQPTATDAAEVVDVFGVDGAFEASTHAPEDPGEFCFPPFAALTTAAARLMLALLERCVRDLNGEIAFGDTDSAAIVASEAGGPVPCPGGREALPDGRSAVQALRWDDVARIVQRFRALSPYTRDAVSGSILKIEKVNVDPKTGQQRPLFALAISAKRYALFCYGRKGRIDVVEAKEHGLGHLLNPVDLAQEDRHWIRQVWAALIRQALGKRLSLPHWVDRPALTRVTVSTTGIWHTFDRCNAGRDYATAVKPMNFGLSPIVARFGHPDGADPEHFHLLGMYEHNPARWLEMPWFDKYSGREFRIGVGRETPGNYAQVRSYRDVILEYRVHPEPKSLDASGAPCGIASTGLLQRRPVHLGSLVYVGKESHLREQVQQGLIHARHEVQPTYPAPQLAAWDLIYRAATKRIALERLVAVTGLGSRAIRYLWTGERRPSPEVEAALTREAQAWARSVLEGGDSAQEDRLLAVRVLGPAGLSGQTAHAKRRRRPRQAVSASGR